MRVGAGTIGLVLVLSTTAAPALALGPPQLLQDNAELDFGIYFGRGKFDFQTSSGEQQTTTEWLGVSLTERFGSFLQLGLHGGSRFLAQPSNPLIGEKELGGKHVGIRLVAALIPGDHRNASLLAEFSVTRSRLSLATDTQHVSEEWTENRAGLWVWLPATASVQFVAGVRETRLSGTLAADGTVTNQSGISGSGTGSAFGINFSDGAAGSVGYLLCKGAGGGGQMYFRRQF